VGAVIGGVGVLVALALGVVGWLLWHNAGELPSGPPSTTLVAVPTTQSSEPPSSTPATVPTRSGFNVVTVPAGAKVLVNGVEKGLTPLELTDLDQGTYEVRAELRGYDARTQTVVVGPESRWSEVSLVLPKTAPTQATADLLSTPFGAQVKIGGASVGVTPLTGYRMKPGTYPVEMTKEGYEPWTGTVVAQAGQKARVDAQLRAQPKATPLPAPTAEAFDPNRVYDNLPSQVDEVAKRVAGNSAEYPTSNAPKLKSGEGVSVKVSFLVTAEGEVTELKVEESAGKAVDDAVLNAVRRWKYTPATKKGTKVKVRVTYKQTFLAG
jgi:TonB family protein